MTRKWIWAAIPLMLLSTITASHADYAVALGKRNGINYSTSYNMSSIAAAEKQALETCGHKSCKIVASGSRECVAVAESKSPNAYWVEAAQLMPEAREKALITCSDGAKRCSIRTSFCDRSAGTGTPAPQVPQTGTPSATPQKGPQPATSTPKTLSRESIANYRSQIDNCFHISTGGSMADETLVEILITYNYDGNFAKPPEVISAKPATTAMPFAESTMKAVLACGQHPPFALEDYQLWKSIELVFSLRDMRK